MADFTYKPKNPANAFGTPKANWGTKPPNWATNTPAGPSTLKQQNPTGPINPNDYIQKGPLRPSAPGNASTAQKVSAPQDIYGSWGSGSSGPQFSRSGWGGASTPDPRAEGMQAEASTVDPINSMRPSGSQFDVQNIYQPSGGLVGGREQQRQFDNNEQDKYGRGGPYGGKYQGVGYQHATPEEYAFQDQERLAGRPWLSQSELAMRAQPAQPTTRNSMLDLYAAPPDAGQPPEPQGAAAPPSRKGKYTDMNGVVHDAISDVNGVYGAKPGGSTYAVDPESGNGLHERFTTLPSAKQPTAEPNQFKRSGWDAPYFDLKGNPAPVDGGHYTNNTTVDSQPIAPEKNKFARSGWQEPEQNKFSRSGWDQPEPPPSTQDPYGNYTMRAGGQQNANMAPGMNTFTMTGTNPETQAMDNLRKRNNPEAIRKDVESGNYANSPEEQAKLDAAAHGRYLQDQGPSMERYTGVMNKEADAMAANREGSAGRIANSTPYGARNAYSPLEGEGQAKYQQGLKSGAPSQEELLASNKAQVDGMRHTKEVNDAIMQNRPENDIKNPKQMRQDVSDLTDSYNIYKRKGGEMGFRQWANASNEKGGIGNNDVKAQLEHNYPGIFSDVNNGMRVENDLDAIDAKSSKTGNTASGKLERRRAGLQNLANSDQARVANAVAHGANPRDAWNTIHNQQRQDQIMQQQRLQQQDYYNAQANIAAAGHPSRNAPLTPFQQAQESRGMRELMADLDPANEYHKTYVGLQGSNLTPEEIHAKATEAYNDTKAKRESEAKANPPSALYLPPVKPMPDYRKSGIPGAPSQALLDPNELADREPKPASPEELHTLHDSLITPDGKQPTREQLENELKKKNRTLPPEPSSKELAWWRGMNLLGPKTENDIFGGTVNKAEVEKRRKAYELYYGKKLPSGPTAADQNPEFPHTSM